MIFNMTGGGGGGRVTVTLSGGVDEVITYTGTESGSATMGENGTATVLLKKGTYSFTGGMSGFSTGSVAVTADQTVTVHPAGALYWYGNLCGGLLSIRNDSAQYPATVRYDRNAVYVYSPRTWSTLLFKPLDVSGYGTLKASAYIDISYNKAWLGAFNTGSTNAGTTAEIPYVAGEQYAETVVSLAAVTGEKDVGIRSYNQYNDYSGGFYFRALWLE